MLEASWKVQFFIKDGKVDWSLSPKPILREYPHRRGDILDTAIEIWELPKMDSSDKPPFGRYLASLDPVDNDGGDDVDRYITFHYKNPPEQAPTPLKGVFLFLILKFQVGGQMKDL